MLQARRNDIMEKIMRERTVKVADLIGEHQVSIETIRRDLEYLERQGLLKRVYGGAVLAGMYKPNTAQHAPERQEEKRAIGMQAAALVEDGDTLFIGSGGTCIEAARCLVGKQQLTVVTDALAVAHEVMPNENCRVILLGGLLRPGELSVSGFLTDNNLRYFHMNKALLGTDGVTLERGSTCRSIEEGHTQRIVLEQSDRLLVLADHSKFGEIALNSSCPVERIHIIVTDWGTPWRVASAFEAAGIQIVTAPHPCA